MDVLFWVVASLIYLVIFLFAGYWVKKQRQAKAEREAFWLRRIGFKGEITEQANSEQGPWWLPVHKIALKVLNKAGLHQPGLLKKLLIAQIFTLVMALLVFGFGKGPDETWFELVVLLAVFGPVGFVYYKFRQRQQTMRKQFPDMLDMLVRSLYAGQGIDTALTGLAEDFPDPIASEIREINNLLSLGVSFREALMEFRDRVPLEEAQYFAITLMIQRESGGRLAEILNELAQIMRRRERFQGKLQTTTAESRFTAIFIGAAPILFIAYKFIFDYESLTFFLNDPTGQKLFIFSISMIFIGTLILRWMLKIRF
jgi:tight adherence protein B